jgi:hypothetical protein
MIRRLNRIYPSRNGLVVVAIVFFVGVVLSGCGGSYQKDITDRFASPNGYQAGDIYKLKESVYIKSGLAKPRQGDEKVTLEEVRSSVNGRAGYGGVIDRGVKLKFTKLAERYSPVAGHFLRTYALIQSGRHKGESIEISYLSIVDGDYPPLDKVQSIRPDPQYLELVQRADTPTTQPGDQ